jgi:hypothetical protein
LLSSLVGCGWVEVNWLRRASRFGPITSHGVADLADGEERTREWPLHPLAIQRLRLPRPASALRRVARREGSRRRAGPRAGRDGASLSQRARR